MIAWFRRLVVAVEGLHALKWHEVSLLERQTIAIERNVGLIERNAAQIDEMHKRQEQAAREHSAAARRYGEYLDRQQMAEDAQANMLQ